MKLRLGWRAVPARRSVHPWCREPVHELDPEPHAHPVLSPSPARAGARILEFDTVGSSPAPRQRRGGDHGGLASALRRARSEEHTSELQSRQYLVCRLLLEKKKQSNN